MAKQRFYYLDNLRVFLTLLVILHHIAIAYGGEGLHPYKDPNPDFWGSILFSTFLALNQSFFMATFFFLSGFFVPGSLARKGPGHFLADRLLRLGVPIVCYSFLFVNVNRYILDVWLRGNVFTPHWDLQVGHLWFLLALLLFNGGYALFRQLWPVSPKVPGERFPRRLHLWLAVVGLSLLTFGVRMYFPVGRTVLGMQPAHFVHYITAFTAGVLCRRENWLGHLTARQGVYWGRVVLCTVPWLAPLAAIAGMFQDSGAAQKLLGGFSLMALSYAVWESILMVGINIWLLWFFHSKYNEVRRCMTWAAGNAFTVYIIHQTVLICIHVLLHGLALPATMKFFVAAILAIPLCFVLSALIRRSTLMRRILG